MFFNLELDTLISQSMSKTTVEGLALWVCHLCERSSKDKSIIRHHVETHLSWKKCMLNVWSAIKNKKSSAAAHGFSAWAKSLLICIRPVKMTVPEMP